LALPLAVAAAALVVVSAHWADGAYVGLGAGRSVDARALGREYAPVLASTYADAWVAAARVIEGGGSVAHAQEVLQQTWKEARVRAFRSRVDPAFSRVLAEGAEPADAAERARVAALWRGFAAGLKGAR